MQTKNIDDGNRLDIQRKYIDHILGSLDFMEIKDKLRDYLELEKDKESNRSLQAEIRHEAPEVLVDNWEDFDEPATLTQEEPHHA
jgi:hypothetical protein